MNRYTGEPTHIEDYLVSFRQGQWFGWTDSKNKIYENLVVHHGTKPTKEEVEAGFKAMKDKWTAEEYKRKRIEEYPKMQEQLDQIYNEGIDAWKATIKAVKDKYPKPS